MKQSLRDEADIILVDARSGQSESGATPTVQMPDAVILLFTSNRQSLEGTAKIATFLKHHPMRLSQGFPELRLLLVPSRVFPEMERYARRIEEEAQPIYSELIGKGIVDRRDQPRGLYQCVLIIDPAATVGESLIVLEPEQPYSTLRTAYEDLTTAIEDLRVGRSLWSTPIAAIEHEQEPTDFASEDHREALRGLEWDEVPAAEYADLAQAEKRGDEHQAARLRYQLGVQELRRRNFHQSEALLKQALDYYKNENETFAIVVMVWLARVYRDQGRPGEGWTLLQPSLALAEARGDPNLVRSVIMELAAILREEQKFQEAFELIERLLRGAEESEQIVAQSFYFHILGHIREEERQLNEAADLFKRSLSLAQKANSIHRQVENYLCLGDVRRQEKQISAAVESYQSGIRLLEGRQGYDILRRKLLLAMGKIRERQKDFSAAKELYSHALLSAENGSDTVGRAICLNHLAHIEAQQGQPEAAFDLYTRALQAAEHGSHRLECNILHSMAHIRERQGRRDESELLFRRSLALAERAGDVHWQLENRMCLAELFRSADRLSEAESLYQDALALAALAGDERRRKIIANGLAGLGRGVGERRRRHSSDETSG